MQTKIYTEQDGRAKAREVMEGIEDPQALYDLSVQVAGCHLRAVSRNSDHLNFWRGMADQIAETMTARGISEWLGKDGQVLMISELNR